MSYKENLTIGLANYLYSRQADLLDYSFDRNGSHNSGEYKEIVTLSNSQLQKVIREYFDDYLEDY